MRALNKKQVKFAESVVLNGGDKVKALKSAGYAWRKYTQAALSVQADKFYNHPNINLKIKKLQAKQDTIAEKDFQIDSKFVLRRLKEIDELDIIDILELDLSRFKPLNEWPKAWRTSISGIDMKRIFTKIRDGDDIETVIDKIKWPDKVKNLEMIGRHVTVKAWENDASAIDTSLSNSISDLIKKLPS